jgi:N-acetylneuraminic acid mutarotase
MNIVVAAALSLLTLTQAGDAPAAASDAWRAEPPMRHTRAAHAVVSDGRSIYAFPVVTFERFDGKAWRDEGSIPGPGLNAPAAVALDGRIYLIGGFRTDTNIPTADVLVYDVKSKTWSAGTPLPAPRGGHAAVVLDGKIHVLGGGNSKSTIADHDVFDPAKNAWTAAAPLPRAEGSPAAVVFGGKVYTIGGRSGLADFGAVDVYDPAKNAWSDGPKIDPRGTAGAALYCDAIYLFGGESQAQRKSLGEVLRLKRGGVWEQVSTMPTPRNFARAVVLDGAVYVVGGSTSPEASHASVGSAIVERFQVPCS